MVNDDNEASVNEKPSVRGLKVSETIFLAAAPVLAYVFTFAYQAGYCDAFELPHEFISTSLTDVLNIGGSVLGVFALTLAAINLVSSFLSQRIYKHPSVAWRISVLLPLLLLVIPFLLLPVPGEGREVVLLLTGLAIMLMFLPPLFIRRFKGSYLQRMEALDNKTSGRSPWEGTGSLVQIFVDVVGRRIFICVVYLSIATILTYSAGRVWGVNRRVFPIANTTPETVVLFMTSERLITAPLDRKNKRIQPVFRVINFDDQTDLTLQLGVVGPLKLVPMKP